MPDEALVDVQALVKLYGPLRAVNEMTFQVRRGEVVGLLGANGAGKSTLMKLLTCYLVADAGKATVAGHSIDADPVQVRRHIGYLPENAPLYNEMMVRDFLVFAARIRGLDPKQAKARIAWAVEACGLKPKFMATIGTLSRGFRQRVGIAQAILHDPDLLILDEPTSGLDPIQLIEIRRLIMDIGRTKTVFFSTHVMQEVEAVCNRALIVAKGKLIADGSPTELKEKLADRGVLVARLRGAKHEDVHATLKDLPGVREVKVAHLPERGLLECTLHVGQDGTPPERKTINAISADFYVLAREKDWTVLELRSEGMSLEDAFLRASLAAYQAAPEGKNATTVQT